MKFKNKIIIAIVLVVTVTLSSVVSMLGMRARKIKNNKETEKIIASGIYEALQSEIGKPIYTSLTMSNDVLLKELIQNEDDYSEKEAIDLVSKYLTEIKNATGAQTTFVISEKSKRYYTYEGLNKVIDPENDEHDVWYSIFVNTRKPYDLDVDTDQVNGDCWTVFVNARIEDEQGKLLGVCGLGLSMENLQQILKEYEDNYGIKVNFINSDGVVQLDTDTVNIETAFLYDVQYGQEKDGYTYKNSDGEYVVMRYVDSLNWYLVVRGDADKILFTDALPIGIGGLCIIVINVIVLFIVGREKKTKKE